MPFATLHATPTPEVYRQLRVGAGLSAKSAEAAARGLPNTLFAVQILHDGAPVGMGRVIGDGGTAFQVVDIAVLPVYQGQGLGKRIMGEIAAWLREHVPETGYVSLLADVPADALYAQFGFVSTAPRTVGMAWKRLADVVQPEGRKAPVDDQRYAVQPRDAARELAGDGNFGGAYKRPDEEVLGAGAVRSPV